MPGCVRRRLLVRSNPPGAMVYVDNQPVGTTPWCNEFHLLRDAGARPRKPGYENADGQATIPAPWFEIPPVDFVSENVAPTEIQDYRTVSYDLVPGAIVPSDQLLDRAQQLRVSTQRGVLPAPAAIGPATPIFASLRLGLRRSQHLSRRSRTPRRGRPSGPKRRPGVLVPPSSGNGARPPGGGP